ncbi:MAG: hypothetical protein GDA55_03305 [Cellvibrionales bacterium]|nr:hypothetical protein [Cellvibrionales bacterium]
MPLRTNKHLQTLAILLALMLCTASTLSAGHVHALDHSGDHEEQEQNSGHSDPDHESTGQHKPHLEQCFAYHLADHQLAAAPSDSLRCTPPLSIQTFRAEPERDRSFTRRIPPARAPPYLS